MMAVDGKRFYWLKHACVMIVVGVYTVTTVVTLDSSRIWRPTGSEILYTAVSEGDRIKYFSLQLYPL